MKNVLKLYDAGAVKRWHTKITIKEQDNAAHSWGVAMIVAQIAPGDYDLLINALTHDLHESVSGDAPYPFKRDNPEVKRAFDRQAWDFDSDHCVPLLLKDEQVHILKWADMFELLLWVNREIKLGNQFVRPTQSVAVAALLKMGHPNEAAEQLFKEVTNELP